MDSRPGADLGDAGSEIVAAAIVHIPAEGRGAKSFAVHPLGHGDAVQCQQAGILGTPVHRDGKSWKTVGTEAPPIGLHAGQEGAHLIPLAGVETQLGNQSLLPASVDEQPFGGIVAEEFFPVDGASESVVTGGYPEFLQELQNFRRLRSGQG